jgi:branched-chain amino acid transport system substrate-binding protein
MSRPRLFRASVFIAAAALTAGVSLLVQGPARTQSNEPIKIGFGIAQTGPLSPNGKSALLAIKIWEEDVNAKGGLLGRPVKLIYYDDQTNPSTVPGLYTKLLDVDKVDLVTGGYGTNMVAPAMPVIIQHKKVFIGLLALAINSEFNYPNYFSMAPTGGTDSKASITKGFFDVAVAQSPKPQTLAIAWADAEFSHNCADGARESAKAAGFKVVYDRNYPPATTDFAPIVRAIQSSNADLVLVCSYPLDSVGMVRAANEIGLKPKMLGGGMVGLQATVFKTQLGPLLNGITNYDFWLPVPKMNFPGVADLMKKYQARAPSEGVDPLGYYMAPFGYAQYQLLGEAITAVKSLDDQKIADYIRKTTFHTVAGDIAFGSNGEWAKARVLQVQFQGIKGNDVGQFRDISTQVVVTPDEYKSGNLIFPYEKAKQ